MGVRFYPALNSRTHGGRLGLNFQGATWTLACQQHGCMLSVGVFLVFGSDVMLQDMQQRR